MRNQARRLAATGVLALTMGCGTPGAPQPPSLRLPRPVADLKAERRGSEVRLSWTMPSETTDRQTIRRYGEVRICRSVHQFPVVQCNQVGRMNAATLAPARKGAVEASYTDLLPAQLTSGTAADFAAYALEVENSEGRSAGLSNQVKVPLAPVPEPSTQLKAGVTKGGIQLSWVPATAPPARPGIEYLYRLERASADKPPVGIADLPISTSSYLDRSFAWQQQYAYSIVPVTRILSPASNVEAEVEGARMPEVKVFANDIFPPAQPGGLQAVYSGNPAQPFIDLTWRPNTESDLAGYNVFRRTEGTAPVQINSGLVKAPAFRDSAVTRGVRYFYSVSAMDLRGNQSPRSQEASETAPAQQP